MKITKKIPIIKPEIPKEFSSPLIEGIKKYDFPVYLTKFKNGIYKREVLTIYTFNNSWERIEKEVLLGVKARVVNGRYHDYGFME